MGQSAHMPILFHPNFVPPKIPKPTTSAKTTKRKKRFLIVGQWSQNGTNSHSSALPPRALTSTHVCVLIKVYRINPSAQHLHLKGGLVRVLSFPPLLTSSLHFSIYSISHVVVAAAWRRTSLARTRSIPPRFRDTFLTPARDRPPITSSRRVVSCGLSGFPLGYSVGHAVVGTFFRFQRKAMQ